MGCVKLLRALTTTCSVGRICGTYLANNSAKWNLFLDSKLHPYSRSYFKLMPNKKWQIKWFLFVCLLLFVLFLFFKVLFYFSFFFFIYTDINYNSGQAVCWKVEAQHKKNELHDVWIFDCFDRFCLIFIYLFWSLDLLIWTVKEKRIKLGG